MGDYRWAEMGTFLTTWIILFAYWYSVIWGKNIFVVIRAAGKDHMPGIKPLIAKFIFLSTSSEKIETMIQFNEIPLLPDRYYHPHFVEFQ